MSDLIGSMPDVLEPEWQRAFAWVERELHGRIVGARRQARWRPAWALDLERAGPGHNSGASEILPLYFRGDRGEADHGAYALEHEMGVLKVLEANGIPVPHVHGFCPDPRGIVMERCRGRANLATARDQGERESVLDDYVSLLARIHELDVGAFEAIGLERPTTSDALGLGDFAIWERGYRRNKRQPEPLIEFVVGWLKRNIPRERDKVSFLCGDSGQFLFDEGRVTTVLDLELAYLGDPAADLAGMRCRDLSEPLGDLGRAVRRYESVVGVEIDRSVIDYHTVRFSIVTPLAVAHLVADPPPGIDFVQYLAWYLVYSRAPLEIIARGLGVELSPIGPPEPTPTRHSQAHRALCVGLGGASSTPEAPDGAGAEEDGGPQAGDGATSDFEAYRLGSVLRVAEYLRRADSMGPAIEASDLDDVARLLGRRPGSWREADDLLEQHVLDADPSRDRELVEYFHRRVSRQEVLIEPVMRELRGAKIQPV